ncbi:aryl-alcohol oxidase [Pseudozyma hubeiensis SY62]|uniref:Aryl-alcohol oxidase n=1 Tax=Pseudozyma hubeiensis (strain SY62) TaxID=1305764 RepID=R9NX88_PSEHS|nr:aryl-alcohol oxidase [Pseudozyma hubeiensis SY62]GAC93181.1 aryl-alcohol oxidase [Pseudozyma hubeiensis SY62]
MIPFLSSSKSNPTSSPGSYATRVDDAATIPDNANHYDFVIVGGGTAGCVLASRLTEDPSISVLVLEAGPTNNVLPAKAPLLFNKLFKTERDWDYTTVPQPKVANRELYWPRGRMLGGSSSMNAMIYHHGSYSDFDEWAEKLGCKGWSYADLAPYFRKSEGCVPKNGFDAKDRGTTGPWKTGHSFFSDMGKDGFLKACEQVGIPFSPDINTPRGTEGITNTMTFIDQKGLRSSAATAYLTPDVLARSNLTVALAATVTRIVFDKSAGTPRATGVVLQTTTGGSLYAVGATRKVVLAAGSINTPQILMLNGIGPSSSLKALSIPTVRVNEHVGAHLKDHFCTSGLLLKAKPGYTFDYLNTTIKAVPALVRWLSFGTGPISSNIAEAAAFIRSNDERLPTGSSAASARYHGSQGVGPDLEIIGAPVAYIDHGFTPAPPGVDIFSLVPIGLRPQSEGFVSIKSKDPFEKAVVDPRYWSDADDNDRKVLLAGLRVCIAITHAEALQPFLEPVEPSNDPDNMFWPWCAPKDAVISDEDLLNWMSRTAFTLYHPVGTARMSAKADDGVVDLDLNVYGVKGLAVCDASIFPQQISGHPTAPIIAIAEKAAELFAKSASI